MDILAWVEELGVWTWWVIAAVLLVLELLAPGVFFLWLAIAAAVVGANALFFDISWQMQIASFAVLSLVAVVASRLLLQRRPIETDRPFLNRRADSLVGQTLVVVEPIENGQGKVRVGDTLWMARGPDLPGGARVRVVEVRDGVLVVEPV